MQISTRIMIALAATALMSGSALAQGQNATRVARSGYTGCNCHFGYGGNSCQPAVSCATEGGRCTAPCRPETSE